MELNTDSTAVVVAASPSPPQWNESATDHAAALSRAAPADTEDADYPLAMDDFELGDFLRDAMDHANHGHGTMPPPLNEAAACDALYILEDLPHPPMNLPPP